VHRAVNVSVSSLSKYVSGNRTMTTQDLTIMSAVEQMPLRKVQITKLSLTITTDVEEKPIHNMLLV